MTPRKQFDIFISYSHKDDEIVRNICRILDEYDFTYFLDKQEIIAGNKWLEKIAVSIEQSRIFMPIISNNSANSEYTLLEIQHAFENRNEFNISIVPCFINGISIDSKLPSSLRIITNSFQCISLEDVSFDSLIKPIRKIIKEECEVNTDVYSLYSNNNIENEPSKKNCIIHPDRPLYGYCSRCDAPLCKECYSSNDPALCTDCYPKETIPKFHQKKKEFKQLSKEGILISIGIGIFYLTLKNESTADEISSFSSLFIILFSKGFFIPFIYNMIFKNSKRLHWLIKLFCMIQITFIPFIGFISFLKHFITLRKLKKSINF